jgi:hypothetical protein
MRSVSRLSRALRGAIVPMMNMQLLFSFPLNRLEIDTFARHLI